MPLGNQSQTVHGGVTLDGQTCHMAAGKAKDRPFIIYLNKLKEQFGKAAIIVDNVAHRSSGRVRRYPEENDDFVD